MAIDTLTDNNRIVDNNPENQQKREHRHHIQCQPHTGKDPQRTHIGDGDTQGHPKGQLRAQKEHQHHKYQNQSAEGILRQQRQAPREHIRIIFPSL